jgi:hypothetical protein
MNILQDSIFANCFQNRLINTCNLEQPSILKTCKKRGRS